MEQLKIEDQISLIMGADEIAATMGTLTHWALFCKPNAKFIALTRTHDLMTLQELVIEATPHVEYYIVDASKKVGARGQSKVSLAICSTTSWTFKRLR